GLVPEAAPARRDRFSDALRRVQRADLERRLRGRAARGERTRGEAAHDRGPGRAGLRPAAGRGARRGARGRGVQTVSSAHQRAVRSRLPPRDGAGVRAPRRARGGKPGEERMTDTPGFTRDQDVWRALERWRGERRRFVFASVTATRGFTPRKA